MRTVLTIALLSLGLHAMAQTSTSPTTVPASGPAGKIRFTVSKETTYFTRPLLANGMVDYVRALNEISGKGVTRDNNFAVVLLEVMGPTAMGAETKTVAGSLGVVLPKEGIDLAKVDVSKALEGPFTAKDFPAVAKWLKDNAKALDKIVEGSKRPKWYVPLEPTDTATISISTAGYSKVRTLAEVIAARAMLAIGEGRYEDAWKDTQAIYRIGALYDQDPTLIGRLVGVAISSLADGTAQKLAVRADLSSKMALQFADDVAKAPPAPTMVSAFVAERCLALHAFQWLATHDSSHWDRFLPGLGLDMKRDAITIRIIKEFNSRVDVDAILEHVNKQYDILVQTISIKSFREREEKIASLSREATEKLKKSKLEDNPSPSRITTWVMDAALGLVTPSLARAQALADSEAAYRELARLAFVLQAYKKDKGEYPDSLKDLVGKGINQVPNDVDGKPIRYEKTKTGYVLTSVGPDGVPDSEAKYKNDRRVVVDQQE